MVVDDERYAASRHATRHTRLHTVTPLPRHAMRAASACKIAIALFFLAQRRRHAFALSYRDAAPRRRWPV